jgi:hypothetical protein
VTVDGAVAGQVGLRGMNLFEGQAELSYWTLPTARNSAVATRAGAAAGSRPGSGTRSRAPSVRSCSTPTAGTTCTCTPASSATEPRRQTPALRFVV